LVLKSARWGIQGAPPSHGMVSRPHRGKKGREYGNRLRGGNSYSRKGKPYLTSTAKTHAAGKKTGVTGDTSLPEYSGSLATGDRLCLRSAGVTVRRKNTPPPQHTPPPPPNPHPPQTPPPPPPPHTPQTPPHPTPPPPPTPPKPPPPPTGFWKKLRQGEGGSKQAKKKWKKGRTKQHHRAHGGSK